MENRKKARTFEKISSLYDNSRISYPENLIDDIISYSGMKNGNILDVGCGTGQATLLFAKKGYNVIGLDPGKEMIDIAKIKCSKFPNTSFTIGTFENIDSPESSFDIIISGMAWHWTDPKTRETKAHILLRNNGTLALFWSYQRKEESNFVRDVGNILDKYGGINRGPAGSKVREICDNLHNDFKKSKLFSSIDLKEYNKDFEFTKEMYIGLVVSYGWVQTLSNEKMAELVSELKSLLENYKEPLNIPYKYVLLLGKCKKSTTKLL